jgi:hypothetical protein
MHQELASSREVVNLSPPRALDEAGRFLAGQSYAVVDRTATTLTAERKEPGGATQHERASKLIVIAVPQPDGGVRIKVRGSDQEGVLRRQAGWAEWMDGLPKRPPPPVVRVKIVPMKGSGGPSGIRRTLRPDVVLSAGVLVALVAVLALMGLAISLLF